jgi:hypothetical protein
MAGIISGAGTSLKDAEPPAIKIMDKLCEFYMAVQISSREADIFDGRQQLRGPPPKFAGVDRTVKGTGGRH